MGKDPKPRDSLTQLDAERAIPSDNPYQAAWHTSRYAFAVPYALNQDVLDAGSGEGYGAAMLASVAASVQALDYSPKAIAHARAQYGRTNLRFDEVDLNRLNGFDGPFGLIVCFEVIEHLADHSSLLAELAKRLAPGGLLLLSTPNLLYHGPGSDDLNPYHLSEVVPRQLRVEVRHHFSQVRLLGQIDRDDRLKATVKLMCDPFYWRRGVRTPRGSVPSCASDHSAGPAVPPDPPVMFAFSRLLTRVSPVTVVLARGPRRSQR